MFFLNIKKIYIIYLLYNKLIIKAKLLCLYLNLQILLRNISYYNNIKFCKLMDHVEILVVLKMLKLDIIIKYISLFFTFVFKVRQTNKQNCST